MDSVPPGFSRRAVPGAEAVLRDDVADALVAAGCMEPETMRSRAERSYEGRGRPFGVAVRGAGRVFVRQYLHGGALRSVTGDLFRGEARFVGELAALVAAAGKRVPVPEPLGIVSRPVRLGLSRGWLLAREIPGARDGLAFCETSAAPAIRHAVLADAGRAMRQLHDAGFEHPDLHLKNLLVTPAADVLVVDLDGVRRGVRMTRERRLSSLFRFDRFAAKQARAGRSVSRADRLRVLKAYAGDEWPARREVREIARRLARHVARHARAAR